MAMSINDQSRKDKYVYEGHWLPIFDECLNQNITDIHLTPVVKGYQLSLRRQNKLVLWKHYPISLGSRLVGVIKSKARMDLSYSRFPQDGRLDLTSSHATWARVSCVMTALGQRLVIRLLMTQERLLDMGQLGLTVQQHEVLIHLSKQPSGLLVFCGATGSGKTTTMYSLLSAMESDQRCLVSLENPIEVMMKHMVQIEYRYEDPMDLKRWVRAVLRQDLDVLVMGEIRSSVELECTINIALSGHLVMTTFHAGSIHQAIKRMKSLTTKEALLTACLKGVVYQQVKKTGVDFSIGISQNT